MERTPTAESFTPYVGEAFRLDDGTALTLVAVKPSRTGFTLILRGPVNPVIAEGMHRLVRNGGPAFTLYMMPVHTPEPGHQDYQIAFN